MRRVVLTVLVVAAALAAPSLASARPGTTYTWCGTDETAQNRVPDLEVSSAQQIRVVYAIPADGTDNFVASASGIVNDVAWIDQWWQSQDPTRTPRFDRYPFAACSSKWGQLDLGFIRLPNPGSYYAAAQTPSVRLDNDLARDFPSTQKTIVYYDGPTRDTQVCGETDYLANTGGGDQGIVYVFPRSGCHLTPLGSGSSAEVAGHELLHNLGAVPQGAPHECTTSEAHACDSELDIMDPYLRSGSTLDSVLLDVGRDDYYAHSGPQWDVQDSSWLERLPQFPFSLAVAGDGTLAAKAGTVQLPCDEGCTSLALDNGLTVSVFAVPKPGWVFSGWSGACSGTTAACTFAIGAASAATATFTQATLRATVAVTGKGSVKSSPAGIACPGTCRATITAASVRLVAKPAKGWRFRGWRGVCTGTKPCVLTSSGAVRAVFARR